jgi:predicted metalloprotease with PDZ domain
MHVVKALTPEKLAVLDQFFSNRVIVSLNLQEIDLSPEFQNVILDAAEAGKIQYLNTVKCRYDLATYKKLNEFNRNGRLGYWNSQGRAMLGIRTDSLIVGGNSRGQMGGALVGTVTVPSAAAAAGILSGDVITKVNDVAVENFEELRRIVAAFDVGDTIQVSVERSGLPQPLKLKVELMQHAQ